MRITIRRRPLHASLLLGLVTTATAAAGIAAPVAAPLQAYIPTNATNAPNGSTSAQSPGIYKGAPMARNAHVRPQSSREKFVPEPDRTGTDTYIVRLHDLPVATYDGRVDGYASTKGKLNHVPGKHGKPTTNHGAEVSAYRQYLHDQQKSVLKLAQGKGIKNAIRHQFTDSLNAFTIDLTQQQAQTLAALPQVDYVQRSGLRDMLTDRGPQFIGADQVWTGNTFPGGDYMGEGMIVGELDAGINTDNHPSFAATGGDGYTVQNPLGHGTYLGDCVATPALCNDKLIGVWSWPVITDTFQGIRPPNGKDYNGHGSHTASTAAGNFVMNVPYMGPQPGNGIGHGVPTNMPGGASPFTFPQISGVAPHANIVAYQVCYPTSGCPDEAILLATEQAITDGVDVINFSIGGSERFPWNDPIALAFLSARDAGIAVAAAAGNAGPNFYTLDHSAPWYIQVAAESHDRSLAVSKQGFTMAGDSTPGNTPPTSSFTSATFGGISQFGTDPTKTYNLRIPAAPLDPYCNTPFPANTFASTDIVVCKRGTITRVGKAFNVQAGGGGGVIITNNSSVLQPTDADDLSTDDVYPIPGIQMKYSQGSALATWIAKPGAHTAQITANALTRAIVPGSGNQLADFSSRGPSSTYTGSMSPNVTAPGVNIFAAYSDEHPFDPAATAASRDFAVLSGTSMATPHVTGTMALVRQAHPDWTAAEVQSALEMTAKDIVYFYPYSGSTTKLPAGPYRAGNGQVDPVAAINAGLVMDETADNFSIANPDNGGDVLQLNLPQLVNNFCQTRCSWLRTVRATRDGTWSTSTGTWTYEADATDVFTEDRAKLTVTPAQFTLKAGQTQTLLIQADMTDVQYRHGGDYTDTEENVELWNKLSFTSSDATVPVAKWPISINFDHGVLPKYLELDGQRDLGAYTLPNVQLPAMNSIAYRSHGLTKANVETLNLEQGVDHQSLWYTKGFSNASVAASTAVRWIQVPAGTSRLVTEVLKLASTTSDGTMDNGYLGIWIGMDANHSGVPDYANETICSSVTLEQLNYCDITNPDPGTYWVVFEDLRGGMGDMNGNNPSEQWNVATAVVPQGDAGNLVINGPAATTGTPVNVNLNWNLSQLQLKTGDVVYGGFDVGAANAPGNVGYVPIKLTRGIDDVTMTTSQTTAKAGDVIDVNVHVRENDSGADRTFNLQSILPSGLTVVPGSVTVSTAAQRGNLQVNGNTVTIAGTQPDSENWPRGYNVTTSDTDPLCRVTVYSANGYVTGDHHVGLYRNLGMAPTMGGLADPNGTQVQQIDLNQFWSGGWAMYNNNAYFTYSTLGMSPEGYVTSNPLFANQLYSQLQLPYATNTEYQEIIAPLWKGVINISPIGQTLTADTLNAPLSINSLNPNLTTGMQAVYASTTGDLILEWDGAKTYHKDNTVSPATTTILDDNYDIDLVINKDVRYGDGQFELIMTYDNINFGTLGTTQGMGSIGLSGYYGPLDSFGPYFGYLGNQYAWNNLKSTLHNQLAVCYDYTGPESTQYDLSMKVRVAETAVGTTQLLRWTDHVDGMPDRNIDATITVSGTIKLAAISDQTTAQDTTLTGIPVVYVDSDGTPDTISVTGANVTAVVHGNTPGSTFDLIPAPGFSGTTQVTVTVSDQNNPSDHASTTFNLTVTGPTGGSSETSIFKDGFGG